jgi:cell shape-determining protein MreC
LELTHAQSYLQKVAKYIPKTIACKRNNVNFVKSQKKMTENIQNSLDNILSKVKSIHGELLKERKNNSDLENEIQQLRATNLEKTNQVFSLETEVETLRSALHLAQNKVVEVPVQVVGKREEEIDELVREIEHCIEQLKQ